MSSISSIFQTNTIPDSQVTSLPSNHVNVASTSLKSNTSEHSNNRITITTSEGTTPVSPDPNKPLNCSISCLHQDIKNSMPSPPSLATSRSSSISAVEPLFEKQFATVGTQTDGDLETEKRDSNQHNQVEEVQKAAACDEVINTSVDKVFSVSERPDKENIGLIKLSYDEKNLYKEYQSQISNTDPRQRLAAGSTFRKLLESLSSREHRDLENNFEQESFEGDYKDDIKLRDIRDIHDFVIRHKNDFIVFFNDTFFNDTLRSMYRKNYGVFKQALTEYLVSREIATKRLGGKDKDFYLEDRLLLKFLGEKKVRLELAIKSLKLIEEGAMAANEDKARELLEKQYPGLSFSEAKEK